MDRRSNGYGGGGSGHANGYGGGGGGYSNGSAGGYGGGFGGGAGGDRMSNLGANLQKQNWGRHDLSISQSAFY